MMFVFQVNQYNYYEIIKLKLKMLPICNLLEK